MDAQMEAPTAELTTPDARDPAAPTAPTLPPRRPPPPRAAPTEPASSGLRLHEGVPDYEKYQFGYPAESGRLFGSGN
jgi:hypothetical protein